MREFHREHTPPGPAQADIAAAMERAHRLRSETLRALCARLWRLLRGARTSRADAIRSDNRPCGERRDRSGAAAFAPTRGGAAPGWRAAVRSSGSAHHVRSDGS